MSTKEKIEKLIKDDSKDKVIEIKKLSEKIGQLENLSKGLKEQIERLEKLNRQTQYDANMWQEKYIESEKERHQKSADLETTKTRFREQQEVAGVLRNEVLQSRAALGGALTRRTVIISIVMGLLMIISFIIILYFR